MNVCKLVNMTANGVDVEFSLFHLAGQSTADDAAPCVVSFTSDVNTNNLNMLGLWKLMWCFYLEQTVSLPAIGILPQDHKNSKCEFGFGGNHLPSFASQLPHKLILNSCFGIPQLLCLFGIIWCRLIHRVLIWGLPMNRDCLMFGSWLKWVRTLAKARRLLNYSQLYHPNEIKHSVLIRLCHKRK